MKTREMGQKCPQKSRYLKISSAHKETKYRWMLCKNQRKSEVILTAKDKLLKTHRESLKRLLFHDMND